MSLLRAFFGAPKATFAPKVQVPAFPARAVAVDAGDSLEPRFLVRSVHAGASVMRGEEYQPDAGWQEGKRRTWTADLSKKPEGGPWHHQSQEKRGIQRPNSDFTTEVTESTEGREG